MRNNIKRLCAENDMSVSELARRIGMQPHALRRYTRCEKMAIKRHNRLSNSHRK